MPSSRGRAAYLAVFLLALAVRGIYLWELADTALVSVLLGDGRQYYAWASEIAAGDWIGGEVFYQAPLYPYLMAVLLAVFGPGTWPLRILQVLMGALSCVFVTHAGRRFFSWRIARVAGVLLALYPPAVFFDGLIQKTSLGLFLTTALLAVVAEIARDARRPWLAGAGALLGLLALTRENALILIPVIVLWLVVAKASMPERGLRVGVFALGLVAVLVPVGLRNLAIGGKFLVTTSQLGSNFYIGNNADANGRYRPLVPGRQDARIERLDAVRLAEAGAGRELTPAEVSRYWLGRSLEWITENPGAWMGLLARKTFLVVGAREVVDTDSIEVYREHSRWLDVLARILHFGVLGPLAALGIWATRREWRRLWVLYALAAALAASLVLFYVVGRYRFSIVPMAALFAAAGAVEIYERWRTRSFSPLVPGVVAAILVAVIQNWPAGTDVTARATTYYNLGVNLFEEGDEEQASVYLEKAVELVPEFAAGHHALGVLLMSEGRLDEAAEQLRRAVSIDPDRALARNLLGNVLAQQGRLNEAVEEYRAALEVDPDLADAHFKLGLILSDHGRLEEALGHLDATVRLLPEYPDGHLRRGIVLERLGRRQAALEAYRRVLDLRPGDAQASTGMIRVGE